MALPALNLPNPLHFPLAVLAGGVVLVVGVRATGLGVPISASAAVACSVAVGSLRRRSELEPQIKPGPDAEAALEQAQASALDLGRRSQQLGQDASARLHGPDEMETLAELQILCQRIQELPGRITTFARQLDSTGASLVPVNRLRQRLAEEERRAKGASGVIQEQRRRLVSQLKANLDLARQGHDGREVRLLNLNLLLESASGELLALQGLLLQSRDAGATLLPTRELELVLDRLDDLLGTDEGSPSP
jgi:hypothetical protein